MTGTVLRVGHESEGQVLAGEIILEVGDPTSLEIAADLLSSDAVQVAAGQRAIVEGWDRGRALEAAVRRVEPFGITKVSALGIEEQRVNVLLDLTEPRERWQRLGHGFRVGVSIVTWEADDVAHAIRALENGVEPRIVESLLLRIANRISENRPGARKENLEVYLERLRRLEGDGGERGEKAEPAEDGKGPHGAIPGSSTSTAAPASGPAG